MNTWYKSACMLQGLRRETADGSFIPVIDGLRFVAIMSVVLYHLHDYVLVKTGRTVSGDWLALLMSKGYIGVQLFFAISGFIIARPFFNRTSPGLKRYFVRRLTRLEPPYLINLLLVFVLLVTVLNADPLDLLPHLAASALYQHNLIYGEMSRINFLTWSLEVEFQFYVLAPALLAVVIALREWIRRMVLLATVMAGGWVYQSDIFEGLNVGATLIGHIGFFAVGILVADIYVHVWKEQLPNSMSWDAIAFLGWSGLMAALFAGAGAILWIPFCILLAVIGSLGGRWFSCVLGWEPFYLIGGMCYTIYLYHFLIISAAGRYVLGLLDTTGPLWLDLLITSVIVVPVIIMGGAIFFLAGEKPFMKWRREIKAVD